MSTEDQLDNIIRRCMICKSIEQDGRLVSSEQYDQEDLLSKGYQFSDTWLSKKCFDENVKFGDLNRYLSQENINVLRMGISYDECPADATS